METDEQLWLRTRRGDPEAFGQLVARHQTLLCSLAYSRCGDLARSEEIAQEAFLAAWRQRETLREPSRLRSWLAGITRNLAHGHVRRERHGGATFLPIESLESGEAPSSSAEDPLGDLVSREEAALLWRTLGSLPESYREPLVLFYRQGRSVSEVARALDLTEDAVRQRLSRGRSLLRENLAQVLERTLERTGPTGAFTAGVLAALPMISSPSAEAATATVSGLGLGAANLAGKGVIAAAKGAAGGLGFGAFLGSLAGLAIGGFSARLLAATARSPEERRCILRHAFGLVAYSFGMSLGLAFVLGMNGRTYQASAPAILGIIILWLAFLLGVILAVNVRMNRRVLGIREANGTGDEAYGHRLAGSGLRLLAPVRRDSAIRFLGLPLWSLRFAGHDPTLPRAGAAMGWLAVGDVALSPLLAVGGIAVAPVAVGGATVGVFSLSLWGLSFGAVAFGSLAVGWAAYGVAAAGLKAAWGGGLAWAGEFAVGHWTSAPEANTAAARSWFAEQFYASGLRLFASNAHWLVVAVTLISLAFVGRRAWRLAHSGL